MTGRRVLVIAYNFPPSASVGTMRTLRLIERLAADDWDVQVLTCSPATYLPGDPVDASLTRRIPRGVLVTQVPAIRPIASLQRFVRRVLPARRTTGPSTGTAAAAGARAPHSTPANRRRSLARRLIDLIDFVSGLPDQEAGWILPAVTRALWIDLRWRPHVVYSTAPPWTAQVIALAVSIVTRRPWVADFRDPWARGPWREDRSPATLRAWTVLERQVVRRADLVVLNTRRARENFDQFYGEAVAEKFRVVANGCDATEPQAMMPRTAERFVLLHAGSIYGGRNPATLIRAVASAIENGTISSDGICVRFLGVQGPQPDLASEIRSLGLQNVVEFVPRVTRSESLAEMAAASALLLLQPGHALSVPAKAYEYLAAGRPILTISEDGATATLVRESGVGLVAAATDQAAIEAALLGVMAMARVGVTPPPRALYDGAERARELVALLTTIVNRGTGDSLTTDMVAGRSGSGHA